MFALVTLALSGAKVEAQTPELHPPVPSPPAPVPVPSGPRFELSLADAVFIGLRDNRTVKSAYIERVSQKYDLFVAETRFVPSAILSANTATSWQGGAAQTSTNITPTATWLLPTGATFGFSWARADVRAAGASSTSDVATLSVNQPLLKGAGLDVNMAPIRVARLQEKINRLSLKSTVSDTVTGFVQAYRALLQAQAQLAIAQDSLERSRSLLATNHALIDAGRMAASEIVQTEADLANQQVAEIAAEQQRNSAQLALLRLLAMNLRTNIVATDQLKPVHVDIDLGHAIEIALDNRMDYLSQREALEQDRQNLIVAKNNRLWNLSVTGNLQYQHSRQSGIVPLIDNTGTVAATPALPGTSGTVGLQLSIPLGDFTLAQGEVQARTTVRTAEVQLDDLQQAVEGQVRDAVQTVDLSWRQVAAARQARVLAKATLDIEREKLKVGRAANFEVLTFEAALRAAETQELSAGIAYLNALTVLDQQLGTTLDTWRITLND